MENLILFGFKGSGKTYFGKRLAQEISFHFVDTDAYVEEFYFNEYQTPLTCREIYKERGGTFFRKLEYRVVTSLEKMTNSVIALGGGTLSNVENWSVLQKMGTFFYLEMDRETLKKRIFSKGIPPFFDEQNPDSSFEALYQERQNLYETIPAYKIFLTRKSDEEIIDQFKQVLYGQ